VLILLTGGSGCGKSVFAESLCERLPAPRYYIAAMRPWGEESERKIARHRVQRREKGFVTIERYSDLAGLRLPARGTALLECVCNLTANEMFSERRGGSALSGAAAYEISDPVERVLSGVAALEAQCGHLLVVTNDVGSDGGGYEAATMAYVAALGRINAALAARADAVYELVCGIPLVQKGALLG